MKLFFIYIDALILHVTLLIPKLSTAVSACQPKQTTFSKNGQISRGYFLIWTHTTNQWCEKIYGFHRNSQANALFSVKNHMLVPYMLAPRSPNLVKHIIHLVAGTQFSVVMVPELLVIQGSWYYADLKEFHLSLTANRKL